MATSIDTNVLVSLWGGVDDEVDAARSALNAAAESGRLLICGAVFAELLADRRRTRESLVRFCSDTEVSIDWKVSEAIWLRAGEAFGSYSKRRRRHDSGIPRRILTDFVIGAHASVNGHSFLTMDSRIYRTSFPELHVIST
jgi:predicted nucleic acid-binding protein